MSKGISSIKGYHGGGGVKHTHGSKTKKSQSAAKQYEKKVESGRERGIRQSQSGSKYDKQVSDYAQTKEGGGFG